MSCGGCAAFLLFLLLILAIGGGIVWFVLAHRNGVWEQLRPDRSAAKQYRLVHRDSDRAARREPAL